MQSITKPLHYDGLREAYQIMMAHRPQSMNSAAVPLEASLVQPRSPTSDRDLTEAYQIMMAHRPASSTQTHYPNGAEVRPLDSSKRRKPIIPHTPRDGKPAEVIYLAGRRPRHPGGTYGEVVDGASSASSTGTYERFSIAQYLCSERGAIGSPQLSPPRGGGRRRKLGTWLIIAALVGVGGLGIYSSLQRRPAYQPPRQPPAKAAKAPERPLTFEEYARGKLESLEQQVRGRGGLSERVGSAERQIGSLAEKVQKLEEAQKKVATQAAVAPDYTKRPSKEEYSQLSEKGKKSLQELKEGKISYYDLPDDAAKWIGIRKVEVAFAPDGKTVKIKPVSFYWDLDNILFAVKLQGLPSYWGLQPNEDSPIPLTPQQIARLKSAKTPPIEWVKMYTQIGDTANIEASFRPKVPAVAAPVRVPEKPPTKVEKVEKPEPAPAVIGGEPYDPRDTVRPKL